VNDDIDRVQGALDEVWLDLADLCRLTGVTEIWVKERWADGLLTPDAMPATATLRFDSDGLHRVVRMASLERDFDAVPELASLVIDLEQERAALRTRLQRLGFDAG
jgi:chaperone modulatory protein CbpM